MRQRLGIAQALLGEPQALILDEPANGLDPEGIAWMRRLLRDFADRGGTVLLSSHLLSEVQATVDHLVVISAGAVVAVRPDAGPARDRGRRRPLTRTGRARAAARRRRRARSAQPDDGSFTVDGSGTDLDCERIGHARARPPRPAQRTAPRRTRPASRTCSSP